MTVTIYTDGAARGNPGNGAYGTILIFGVLSRIIQILPGAAPYITLVAMWTGLIVIR